MANVIEYILKLKDEATKELDKFGGTIEKSDGKLKNLGKTAGIMGAAITGAGLAGVLAMKDWVGAASEAEVEMAKFEGIMTASFGNTPKMFKAMREAALEASTTMIKLGFDDEETAVSFAKLGQVTGNVAEAQKMMAIAADLARFKGVGLAESTQALTLAYMGNTKILKQMGIEVEDGMTQQEIMTAIQKKAAGQAENYSQTLQGQMDTFNILAANIKENLGAAIIPTLLKFANGLNGLVEKLGQLPADKVEFFVKIFAVLTGLALIIGPFLMFVAAIPLLAAGFAAIAASAGAIAVVTGWIAAILALIAAGYWLITHWDLVKQKAVEVWGAIQQLFQTVMTAIVGFFTTAFSAITTFFENLPKMIWDFLGMATLKIIEWTAFILAYLIFAIPQWIEAIISFVSTLPSKVGAWLTETYNGITTWGTNTGNYFATTVPVWIANITTWFAALPGKISSALSGLGKTLVSSFGDAWNNLLGTLAEWKNNIWEWGKNIASAFIDGFKNAISGIANAFKEGVENARKSIEGHSPPVAGPLKDIDKWGYNIGNAWVAGLKSAISDFQMPAIGGSTYNQNINVNAPINNNLDAYSLASILGQQLAFSGKYD